MTAGLLSAILALFIATWSVREILTALNRADFVQTEFEVDTFVEAARRSPSRLEGTVVSSGELYTTSRESLVGGLELLRDLKREQKLKGYRASIWYLPRRGSWTTIDRFVPFRLQSPEEFGQTSLVVLLGINGLFAAAAVALIRRGAGLVGARPR